MIEIKELCSLVASDRAARRVSLLCAPELWSRALDLLVASSSLAIVTGFYVPSADAPETDGPSGAVVLGRALARSKRNVTLFTDPLCYSVVKAASQAINGPDVVAVSTSEEILASNFFDAFVYIERLGKNSSGCYHNMRGKDISQWTAPLDDAVTHALKNKVSVLAVGDGGNEAGMGVFFPELSRLLPEFKDSLSIVSADVTLPVDVSSWGGYALAALLSLYESQWLGQTFEEEEKLLAALYEAGAVDGVTKKRELSIDSFPLDVHIRIVESLYNWWRKSMNLKEERASGVFQ